ncbi:chorismate mutase [Vibrio sp.]|nr:chorismate mutase [Vibrio sp.]
MLAKNGSPIEDIPRERVVIEKARLSASKSGLDKESVEAFFAAQISAAKAIQYRYRADLLSKPVTSAPRDLVKEIRPALLVLGNQINEDIAAYLKQGGVFAESDWVIFNTTVKGNYLTEEDKKLIFKSLSKIKLQS